ncbi:MAG TPA: TerC family protein [Thermoanaerobaculia bacterium]|nr:TerC family protein [Thermoanaerobaculia bacterium]
MSMGIWPWVFFNLFVLLMLALDLGVFHRKVHAITIREALIWSGVWIALALTFNGVLYFWLGADPALEFFTGYVIEKSLSVDNIFVIVLIFSFFRVPAELQHRVLFWGILGALAMRGAFIGLGSALLHRFEWVIYLFGAFLVITGIKMAMQKDEVFRPEENLVTRLARRLLPISADYEGKKFFSRVNGRLVATPLFLVLLIVESTDLIFAVDSIPAIFAVTKNSFIVYTSNICAILGLRSLYFALAGMMSKFVFLKLGLSAVLSFVGLKMLVSSFWKMPTLASLGVIVGILSITIVASLISSRRKALRDARRPA